MNVPKIHYWYRYCEYDNVVLRQQRTVVVVEYGSISAAIQHTSFNRTHLLAGYNLIAARRTLYVQISHENKAQAEYDEITAHFVVPVKTNLQLISTTELHCICFIRHFTLCTTCIRTTRICARKKNHVLSSVFREILWFFQKDSENQMHIIAYCLGASVFGIYIMHYQGVHLSADTLLLTKNVRKRKTA